MSVDNNLPAAVKTAESKKICIICCCNLFPELPYETTSADRLMPTLYCEVCCVLGENNFRVNVHCSNCWSEDANIYDCVPTCETALLCIEDVLHFNKGYSSTL